MTSRPRSNKASGSPMSYFAILADFLADFDDADSVVFWVDMACPLFGY